MAKASGNGGIGGSAEKYRNASIAGMKRSENGAAAWRMAAAAG